MRESVLRDLAEKAATDSAFLDSARRDLAGTLDRYGYELTADEMEAVEDLRRRTAVVGDATLAAMLAGGLRERGSAPPVRPAAPTRPGSGFSKPTRPGTPEQARRGPLPRRPPEGA